MNSRQSSSITAKRWPMQSPRSSDCERAAASDLGVMTPMGKGTPARGNVHNPPLHFSPLLRVKGVFNETFAIPAGIYQSGRESEV